MTIEEQDKQKYQSVVNIAVEHATDKGLQRGFGWLQKAFNEYFDWHEGQVEDGALLTFGGQPYSDHNRRVCAGKLARTVRFEYVTDESQLRRLSHSLAQIVDGESMSRGFHR